MTEQTIKQLLDNLARAQDALAAVIAQKESLRNAVLTPEVQQALEDIETEFAVVTTAATMIVTDAEAAVKAAVVEHGASVKNGILQAVYSAPRVSYDSKALDGLLIAMPELSAFRKESAPSVSIRKSSK
jgi:hydrogenase maturation factor HypE